MYFVAFGAVRLGHVGMLQTLLHGVKEFIAWVLQTVIEVLSRESVTIEGGGASA
jgi:hypothetical protein